MQGHSLGIRRRTAAVTRGVSDEVDDLLGRGPYFTHQPLGPNLDPRRLLGYYCDFRHKAEFVLGCPPEVEAELTGMSKGAVIPLAQTALGFWELMVEGYDLRDRFLFLAEWLATHHEPAASGEGVVWNTHQPVSKYGLGPSWASAMGQGEAMSVLLRAHELTGEKRYADVARDAFAPLLSDVAVGGLSRRIDGHLVLEEYPTERPTAVLNGWMFALFGVHELAEHALPAARALLDESLDGLLALLHRYDAGWWSLYSLHDHGRVDLAKPFYQRLHPVLLRALATIRPDDRLLAMAERWEAQLTPAAIARLSANKLVFRARRRTDVAPSALAAVAHAGA